MSDTPSISWDQILFFVDSRKEFEFKTRRGLAFSVERIRDVVCFTPKSTGLARPETRRTGERFVEEFNRTGITTTSHYQKISANASYVLSLIDELTNS